MTKEDVKIILFIGAIYVVLGSWLIADLAKKGIDALVSATVTSALFVGTIALALFVRTRNGSSQ